MTPYNTARILRCQLNAAKNYKQKPITITSTINNNKILQHLCNKNHKPTNIGQ